MEFHVQFPNVINSYITDIIDPSTYSHYDRAIVGLLGITGTDGWIQVCKDLFPMVITYGRDYIWSILWSSVVVPYKRNQDSFRTLWDSIE